MQPALGVRYAIKGSVRKGRNQVRVTSHLIDTASLLRRSPRLSV